MKLFSKTQCKAIVANVKQGNCKPTVFLQSRSLIIRQGMDGFHHNLFVPATDNNSGAPGSAVNIAYAHLVFQTMTIDTTYQHNGSAAIPALEDEMTFLLQPELQKNTITIKMNMF